MSVLINGMKMPRSCAVCEWSALSYPNALCRLKKKKTTLEIATTQRAAFCPLIEVKSPHGRLIDADELITKVQKLYCKDCILRTGKKNGKMQYIYEIGEAPCRGCWIDDMVSEIGDAPTIIEAEGSET